LEMNNELYSWLRNKDNWPYILMLVLAMALATYKYNFFAAIIVFLLIMFIGFTAGYVINKFIE